MRVSEEAVQRLVAEALAHEYTQLSALGYEAFHLANELDDLDRDDLRRAKPDTIRDELRRLRLAVRRLSTAFESLAEDLDDAACA